MQIFISHSTPDTVVAEEIAIRLQGDGHTVFFDRSSLRGGDAFDVEIRHAIERSQLFIFLITPSALEPRRYCLTELRFARERWPNPKGVVLPVLAVPMPKDQIPAYLRAVTILEPEGNLPAEVAYHVAIWAKKRRRKVLIYAAALSLCASSVAGGWYAYSYGWLGRNVPTNQPRSTLEPYSTPPGAAVESEAPDYDVFNLGKEFRMLPKPLAGRLRAAAVIQGQFVVLAENPTEIGILKSDGHLEAVQEVGGTPVDVISTSQSGSGDGLLAISSPAAIATFRVQNASRISIEKRTEVPSFYLADSNSDEPGKFSLLQFPKSHSISNVPGSLAAAEGNYIWIATQKDAEAIPGLLILKPDGSWELPSYQTDFELEFDIGSMRIFSAGGEEVWGVVSSIPHSLYEFSPTAFARYKGHDHDSTIGMMAVVTPGTRGKLMGLGSDYEPFEFNAMNGKVEIKQRWPKLGAFYSTATWDNEALTHAGDRMVAGMTAYVRGDDYHAIGSSVADLKLGEPRWRKLFTLPNVEIVDLETNGTESLLIVKDRHGAYQSYWISH